MGTPDFAVPSLSALIKSKHKILSVITQPDRPSGRGKKLKMPPVKEVALEHNIQVLQPKKIREESFISSLKALKPDIIVVIAYGQILPKEILTIPEKGCVNVHASLLPAYRGAAPIHWAIIKGEKKTGITTMYMDEGLDTGDMILKDEVEIKEDMTAGELHDVLANLGAKTLLNTLDNIENDKIISIPQDHTMHTYAPMLDKNVGKIDWSQSADHIFNLIRGTNPWPGAFTELLGKKMKVWKAGIFDDYKDVSGKPGEILQHIPHVGWIVKTGDGCIVISQIQMPNGKRMSVDAFVLGNQIQKGTILGQGRCE